MRRRRIVITPGHSGRGYDAWVEERGPFGWSAGEARYSTWGETRGIAESRVWDIIAEEDRIAQHRNGETTYVDIDD